MTSTPASFDPVAEAKRLLRTLRAGTLATLQADGWPLASLVATATMPDGKSILLLSRLASHTGNLEQDARCSLLLAATGKGDPLAHPRLTLDGRAHRVGDDLREAARSRFLRRNPKAQLYADFPDFGFWLFTPRTAHLNGGFGKAALLTGADVLTDVSDAADLIQAETGAIAHMQADHADAVALYATRLLGQTSGAWQISGLDPDGLDLVCGDRVARLVFPSRVTNPADLRRSLVDLAKLARDQRD
jgi:heme iron utilization protein